ncbi:VOC family protein [Flavobacterium terrisoli]|uniref:VOC family protein n=1 Tax=Flavobacterium terrisoli TaxID=3242195 RepID=UPI002542BC8A|nr:VOC family protein [Flavobacterium buctense]
MKNNNGVVHFEMPAEDRKRMADFYADAFGWKTELLGEDMGNYTLVTTTEIDEKGMIKNPGAINGGFYPKNDVPKEQQHPSVVIGVEDINETINKIRNAGGQVLGEPVEIPGHGMYVAFNDTEGNRSGVMQPFETVE